MKTKTEKQIIIDIVMLSKFGKKDGGRETWLYLFLPNLLKNEKISRINVYGYRTTNQEDNTELLKKLDPLNRDRIKPYILDSKSKRYPKIISFHIQLRKLLKKNPPPPSTYAIGVGGMFENSILLLNKKFRKSKTALWLRTIFLNEKAYVIPSFLMPLLSRVEKLLLGKIDVIIANGEDTKAFYEKKYGLNITVIKNAIDPIKWEMPNIKKTQNINIAYIGRLSEVKGIKPFLELASIMKKKHEGVNYNFHVVGDANNFLEEVRELHKKEIITYHGSMNNDQLPKFLTKIEVCVALTYVSTKGGGAGLSNALLEQMAAGKIIIAWDNAAFNQILTNECAYIIEQYSVDGLVNSVEEIFQNQTIAIEKAKEAKIRVKPYTINDHVNRFEKLLNI